MSPPSSAGQGRPHPERVEDAGGDDRPVALLDVLPDHDCLHPAIPGHPAIQPQREVLLIHSQHSTMANGHPQDWPMATFKTGRPSWNTGLLEGSLVCQMYRVHCSVDKFSAVQFSAVCSPVQCSALQCSSVQYSKVQCSAVQFSAVQYSAVHCSELQCSVGQCSAV